MNKKKIEKMLPRALETLADQECGISSNGKINKSYRSAISSFGAAVTMGSFRAAVSFFSKDADGGDAGIYRSRLLRAMEHVVHPESWKDVKKIVETALAKETDVRQMQDNYLHAAVALKLAMNAFDLDPEDKQKDKPKEGSTDGKSKSAVQ